MWALLVAAPLAAMFAWALAAPGPRRDVVWGVTFSPRFARSLGLDPQAIYGEMLDELGVRHVRLPVYWDEVEPSPDDFDFSRLDYYLAEAQARGVGVLLVVGYKQPRWPECYLPPWATDLPTSRVRERILKLIEAEVVYLRGYPNILMWQAENEPFRRFGECRGADLLNPDLMTAEIQLIKRLDPRPVLMTDSGELSTWGPAVRLSEYYLGTALYRQISFRTIGRWQHPLPAWSYTARDRVVRALLGKGGETIIVELQAEAWFQSAALVDVPAELQKREFPADLLLVSNVEYARRTQFSPVYIWGAEWWYWMEAQGYPEYLEAARRVFRDGDQ